MALGLHYRVRTLPRAREIVARNYLFRAFAHTRLEHDK